MKKGDWYRYKENNKIYVVEIPRLLVKTQVGWDVGVVYKALDKPLLPDSCQNIESFCRKLEEFEEKFVKIEGYNNDSN